MKVTVITFSDVIPNTKTMIACWHVGQSEKGEEKEEFGFRVLWVESNG